ncbi:D-alanyl-lipoteichoic acid acyltransferase DltB, MBOAT superfamily [Pseudobutyrivibrio sp. UC1225]|uniref:MBOAT family O-acyltransferase n=1 Tax=Pseudobutyrivibrio sp. UC1225 TaxID=1798185 RepID=UPI0008DF5BD9|nr:MBOAT family O-acyltransferase [Pseudobutyrivibrio sp. UC1225]SFO21996.1 D-alanyl-lipoteichoic acid acyltransferase DltB, MBOAT superfamily [Pseudobutyrivibrio sp. UC1225]
MQFNTYEFVFFFLPFTVILYFIANKIQINLGKLVLIGASIIFYSYGRSNMLAYFGISILINYCSILVIRYVKMNPQIITGFTVATNIVLLLYFKYFNFLFENINMLFGKNYAERDIILPLGISFYTFQQISYVVAFARGELEEYGIIDYMAYILYFPKLIMGPLADPLVFIQQLNDKQSKSINFDNIACGIKLFSLGLIKKVLLADTFAKAVTWAYSNVDSITSMDGLLLMLFYTFEIYFDFSGYSDMAVGISLMLNIELPINFNSPYKAISVRDFWKRWHISLTQFLTKYIYIPLGGSRKGIIRTYVNTLIVFLISGLWHGANWTFILWGLLHGILSCFDRVADRFTTKVFKPIRWICTFITTSILWLLFSAESVEQWKSILIKTIVMQDKAISRGLIDSFYLIESEFVYKLIHLDWLIVDRCAINMILFMIVSSIICFIPKNNYVNRRKLTISTLVLATIGFVWGILCLGTESTFVYFGF